MKIFWVIFLGIFTNAAFAQNSAIPLQPEFEQRLKTTSAQAMDTLYAEAADTWYAQQNDKGFINALACYNKSLEYAQKSGNSFLESYSYKGIASVYDAQGADYGQAAAYYEKSYSITKKTTDSSFAGFLCYCIAQCNMYREDSASVLKWMSERDRWFSKQIFNTVEKKSYYLLGQSYLLLQIKNQAGFIKKFEQVDKTLAYNDGGLLYAKMFAHCMAAYYTHNNNIEKAIETTPGR